MGIGRHFSKVGTTITVPCFVEAVNLVGKRMDSRSTAQFGRPLADWHTSWQVTTNLSIYAAILERDLVPLSAV
jgi:hypothetical protein